MTLEHTTVTDSRGGGGGIWTRGGTVTIAHSTIADNSGVVIGGLIISGGTVTLKATTVRGNTAQGLVGGIANGSFGGAGTVIIMESAITNNRAGECAPAAGILNNGTMVITNTTIAANTTICPSPAGGGGGGITNSAGTLILTNSTVADNAANASRASDGITQRGGSVLILNTIIASNSASGSPDCAGSITSLGTNLIGDPTGCTITLQPSDLTGDPGLDTFTDNGGPGKGHFPLLPTSQAIDAGNDAICPRTDQLGRRRIGPCDIGAIEFRERDDRQHHAEDEEDVE